MTLAPDLDTVLSMTTLAPVGSFEFERLEFLGDPVLEYLVALDRFPGARNRAELSDALSAHSTDAHWARLAQRSGLVSRFAEPLDTQRQADLVEALAGAIYLAGGWVAAAQFARAIGALDGRGDQSDDVLVKGGLGDPWLDAPGTLTVAAVEYALGVMWNDSRWISHALYDDCVETGHHVQGLLAALGFRATEYVAALHYFAVDPPQRVGYLASRSARLRSRSRLSRTVVQIGLRPVLEGAGDANRALHALIGAVLVDRGRDRAMDAAARALSIPTPPALDVS